MPGVQRGAGPFIECAEGHSPLPGGPKEHSPFAGCAEGRSPFAGCVRVSLTFNFSPFPRETVGEVAEGHSKTTRKIHYESTANRGEMTQRDAPIKVMVAKIGLDGHDRGVKVISRALRDAGMEVLYLGMRLTDEAIAKAAEDEDVDVVGISILSGAHMRLMPRLIDALKARGISDDVLLLVGGTIPEQDVEPLQQMGVAGVFPVGSFTETMVKFIRERVRQP